MGTLALSTRGGTLGVRRARSRGHGNRYVTDPPIPTNPPVPPPDDPPVDAGGAGSPAPASPPIIARPLTALPPTGYARPLLLVEGPPQPPVLSVGGVLILLLGVAAVYSCAGATLMTTSVGPDGQGFGTQVTLGLTQWFIFLGLPLLVMRLARVDLRMTYSWYRPRGDLTILTVAMALCLVGVIQYAGDLAMMLLAGPYDRLLKDFLPTTADRFAYTTELIQADTASGLVVAILLAGVTPAICEEHFFRGVVQSTLDKRLPPAAAVLVVATIFAAFHVEPVAFVAFLLIGLFVGVFTSRSGCILYACLIHLANNTLSVLMQNWTARNVGELPVEAGSFDSLPVYLVGGAAGIAAFLARTPRRHRRRWHEAPAHDDPTVFRPGWGRGVSLWLARRWRLAVVVAMACSLWGAWLDVRDLREIAAKSQSQSPAPARDEEDDDRDIREQRPYLPNDDDREEPELLQVDAGEGLRAGHGWMFSEATSHSVPGLPAPSTMGTASFRPMSRSPSITW